MAFGSFKGLIFFFFYLKNRIKKGVGKLNFILPFTDSLPKCHRGDWNCTHIKAGSPELVFISDVGAGM